jgi:hypothetical protein
MAQRIQASYTTPISKTPTTQQASQAINASEARAASPSTLATTPIHPRPQIQTVYASDERPLQAKINELLKNEKIQQTFLDTMYNFAYHNTYFPDHTNTETVKETLILIAIRQFNNKAHGIQYDAMTDLITTLCDKALIKYTKTEDAAKKSEYEMDLKLRLSTPLEQLHQAVAKLLSKTHSTDSSDI